jgi:hypothetical protein
MFGRGATGWPREHGSSPGSRPSAQPEGNNSGSAGPGAAIPFPDGRAVSSGPEYLIGGKYTVSSKSATSTPDGKLALQPGAKGPAWAVYQFGLNQESPASVTVALEPQAGPPYGQQQRTSAPSTGSSAGPTAAASPCPWIPRGTDPGKASSASPCWSPVGPGRPWTACGWRPATRRRPCASPPQTTPPSQAYTGHPSLIELHGAPAIAYNSDYGLSFAVLH